MEQILPHLSLRFFPKWNTYDSNQVVGFLNMVNYILERKRIIENWVELGSFIGESANMVLGFPNIKHIDCVDASEELIKQASTRLNTQIKKNRCSIHHKLSADFLNEIPNNYMDVVYIDANHEYDFVKKDIELSFSKLQSNGFLCGHDYALENSSYPGCVQAIQEFSEKKGLKITRFIDNSWLMVKE
jgi:predicted O-methyltransferase YrrM